MLAACWRAASGAKTVVGEDEEIVLTMEHVRGVELPFLRAWRMRMAMSQGELVQRTGLARSTVARAETGKEIVSFPNIRKLATALSITPEQLMRIDPDADGKRR